MNTDADALVIGGGPAGAASAIGLAMAGWRVSLVEQHAFPRQKVCGECIAAGNFQLLDELGVGRDIRRLAGPELERTGWMSSGGTVVAAMPRCASGADEYGRALGRDVLDALLLQRAASVGVTVLQPARVRSVTGRPGQFRCDIVHASGTRGDGESHRSAQTVSSSLIIDARGSWESGPRFEVAGNIIDPARAAKRPADLFAFKASFTGSRLESGFLPVIAISGGYGGMVLANAGRTTLALCLRRDALGRVRARYRGLPAGVAVEMYLRETCPGVSNALRDGERQGAWLTVGPIRPGFRLSECPGIYRVGNASGETHPLVGEGISMALQSSRLLVASLLAHGGPRLDDRRSSLVHSMYANAWRAAFVPRLRFAAAYAGIAMRPALSAPIGCALYRWPVLLTTAARLAGKARPGVKYFGLYEETV